MTLLRAIGHFLLLLCLLFPTLAEAQRREPPRLIRDAEIEATLEAYSVPLMIEAGLDPKATRMYIVQDKNLNAFVAGGQRIFLHTGLLEQAKGPGAVIGVIAHEIGHISGAHLSRLHARLETLSTATILSYLLGIGAAVGSGDGGIAGAVLAGTQQVGQRSFLSYTRGHERSADQTAVRLLDRLQYSARELLGMLKMIEQQGRYYTRDLDPFSITHPMVAERIEFLRNHIETSPYSDRPFSQDLLNKHARMRGKLMGYLYEPQEILDRLRTQPDSLKTQYARMIALYRLPDIAKADQLYARLAQQFPNDPYLYDLKAELRSRNGRPEEAVTLYRKAHRLAPESPMIRYGLSKALLALPTAQQAAAIEAEPHLRWLTRREPDNVGAWRLLSVAYGRQNKLGLSSLASAERAYLQKDVPTMRLHLQNAQQSLNPNSQAGIRVQDLKKALRELLRAE